MEQPQSIGTIRIRQTNNSVPENQQETITVIQTQTSNLLDYIYAKAHETLQSVEQDVNAVEAMRCLNFALDQFESACSWATKGFSTSFTPKAPTTTEPTPESQVIAE